jgi:hypothetical protein
VIVADLDIKAIEEAFQSTLRGVDTPDYVLAPEGVFIRAEDGSVRVYDFDSQGNHYELTRDEQDRRIAAFKMRLGLE